MSFEKHKPQEISPHEEAEANEKIQRIRQQFRQIYQGPDMLERHSQITDFINNIKQKFPDYHEYAAFHIAAGSSPQSFSWSEFPSDKIDFPKQYSVENFFDQLTQEKKSQK